MIAFALSKLSANFINDFPDEGDRVVHLIDLGKIVGEPVQGLFFAGNVVVVSGPHFFDEVSEFVLGFRGRHGYILDRTNMN